MVQSVVIAHKSEEPVSEYHSGKIIEYFRTTSSNGAPNMTGTVLDPTVTSIEYALGGISLWTFGWDIENEFTCLQSLLILWRRFGSLV